MYDGLSVLTTEGDHLGQFTRQAGELVTSGAQDQHNRQYAIQAGFSGRAAPVFFAGQDHFMHNTVTTVGEPTTQHGVNLGTAMNVYRGGDDMSRVAYEAVAAVTGGRIDSAINPTA